MKVLMVHENPWKAGNPYISTLIDAIQQLHPDCHMAWGRDAFWSDDALTYDIIHFHWPQTFMGRDPHSEEQFQQHIDRMRAAGVKILATCHDLKPHYRQFAEHAEAMRIVYERCEVIIHLGSYSLALFQQLYPQATHVLIPHHLYDTLYPVRPSRQEALQRLNLPADRRYVLCFGAFRARQERELIKLLGRALIPQHVTILAPSFMNVWWHTFRHPLYLMKKAWLQHRYHIRCTGSSWRAVSDAMLPYYYAAADVVFVQRVKILNSGNALLPMLFGRVVAGPDCGNVGPLLRHWGYPTFPVDAPHQAVDAVRKALALSAGGLAEDNRPKQLKEYSTTTIAHRLYQLYQQITA